MSAMEEEKRLGDERAWGVMEQLLIALTFGCFGVMTMAVSAVSAAQLRDGQGGWLAKLLSLLLPGLVMAGTAALCRRCLRAQTGVPLKAGHHSCCC